MKKSSMKLAGSVLIGVAGLSLPAWAQNEALRTCRAEWRANQAGLRDNGITQKVYVAGTVKQPRRSWEPQQLGVFQRTLLGSGIQSREDCKNLPARMVLEQNCTSSQWNNSESFRL